MRYLKTFNESSNEYEGIEDIDAWLTDLSRIISEFNTISEDITVGDWYIKWANDIQLEVDYYKRKMKGDNDITLFTDRDFFSIKNLYLRYLSLKEFNIVNSYNDLKIMILEDLCEEFDCKYDFCEIFWNSIDNQIIFTFLISEEKALIGRGMDGEVELSNEIEIPLSKRMEINGYLNRLKPGAESYNFEILDTQDFDGCLILNIVLFSS